MGWTTGMVAYPCGIVGDEGHVTLEYLGETDLIGASKEEVADAVRPFAGQGEFEVPVLGIRLFGVKTGSPVWVAQLDSSDITPVYESVVQALNDIGVENASSYADEDYKPHVTIKPFESYSDLDEFKDFPGKVTLGPLQVWWNEERIEI